ncbi:MAG: 5'-cyclic adenosine monophosphate phosphodiesterase CpdA [Candidatus Ordinivivax streblomastigis]|uniref:5'-cyclic adenosine monophosphate phosphodiesterase CpdA n=1 Tax=Candidatus Ordinivivax streblomastigis TaxID=2540710 RepID=A0A5M8P585_9BACT|nr:MAG: 5'-cyclic adenosine monophosphate phosphodiesterase CpdA [Candidatus Ordinivivax streblomastigis]KAA6303416.1 MAG: 5'-cyclic adenosine monophosphate phosphodiesterase CpdA [Candidatus Ordinivivax streblomastigis]
MNNMVFFMMVFVIYTLINGYLFYRGWKTIPKLSPVRGGYSVLFFLIYASFLVAMLGRNVIALPIQTILYRLGIVWLGFMLYLTLWFVITDLIRGLIRWFVKRKSTICVYRVQVVAGYILVSGVLMYGYYRFLHPAVVEKEIVIHKSGVQYSKLDVLVFSDLHLGVSIDKKRLQQYVQFINAQHADLILIAGDVVDNNVRPLEQKKMNEELDQLQAPLGVYMCLGNHEYLSGIEGSVKFLRNTKINVLIDSVAPINDSFWIIGRDDKQGNPRRQSLKSLTAQTDPSQALLLMDHEPYLLEEAEQEAIDLQVSGHTHHGQMWPFNYLVDKLFENSYGYLKKGATQVYVSSGLGLWGPPFRIGTQSEIVVFHLTFSK